MFLSHLVQQVLQFLIIWTPCGFPFVFPIPSNIRTSLSDQLSPRNRHFLLGSLHKCVPSRGVHCTYYRQFFILDPTQGLSVKKVGRGQVRAGKGGGK